MKPIRKLHFVAVLVLAGVLSGSAGLRAQSVTNCDPMPAGVVGWWKADGDALDSAGTNNGTLQSGAGFAAGEVGQAFSFSGAGASVNIPRAPELDVGNQVTVEFWMKADPSNAMDTYQGLVTSDFYGIEIADGRSLAQTMGLNFFVSTDSGAFFPQTADANGGGAPVSAGQWHHVAGTYDGTQLQLYVDGQATGNPYPYSGPISPMLANSFVTIGSEDGRMNCASCVNARYFNGLIDEATIYNRALTAAEIAAIYQAGSNGKCFPPPSPPSIYVQPQDLTVDAGLSGLFWVRASGSPPLSYQWYFESTPIAGGTSTSLLLNSVQTNQAGSYHVVITNLYGSVTSSNAFLTVLTVPPTITTQPQSTKLFVGSTLTLSVSANGTGQLGYQWYKDSNPIAGADLYSYRVPSAQTSNSGTYFVVITNLYGSVTSSNAIISVVPVPPVPTCTPVPPGVIGWWRAENNTLDSYDSQDAIVPYATELSYTAGKVGTAFNFSGQNYLLVPDSPALHVTDGFAIEAWINPGPTSSVAPQIIAARYESPQPQLTLPSFNTQTNSSFFFGSTNNGILCLTVTSNGQPTKTVSVLASAPVPRLQWSHVAATYDGASLKLYLNGAVVAKAPYAGGIFAGTSDLTFGALVGPPGPRGTPPRSIAWPWFGALDEISFYGRALSADEIQAIYNADFAGKCLLPPVITVQPQSQAVPLGEDVLFTPTVLGSKPLLYQWRFNGTNLLHATASSLLLEKIATNQAGNYSVLISNTVGTILSSNATLTLLPALSCTPPPTNIISWWPADGSPIDVIGTNNPSSLFDITYPTGKVSMAFGFNGLRSQIVISNTRSLNFGSNATFSIEAWIKVQTPPLLDRTFYDNMTILEKRQTLTFVSPPDSGYALSLYRGRLSFWITSEQFLLPPLPPYPPRLTAPVMYISPGPDLRDGMFHHIAATLDGAITNGGNLYVDGQLVLNFNALSKYASLSNGAPLSIGRPSGSPYLTSTNSPFDGMIDELTVYGRVLTPGEVLAIREAGAAGKCKMQPFIITQPANQTAPLGSNVTFTVVAGGAGPLSYQWRFGSESLLGATRSSLTITNVTSAKLGFYSVRVTNDFGSVISTNAALVINTPPIARCTNVTVAANSNCVAFASVDNGSLDADGDAVTLQQSPPGPYPLGTNIVMLTAIDKWGATNTCMAMVRVVDQTPPQISCPGDIVAGNDLNQCGAVVSFAFPTAVDSCSGVTNITCIPPPGSFFPVGTTMVRVSATDGVGNTSSCSFNVTVHDTQPPAISCPGNITVEFTNETGAAVSFNVQASDNCAGTVALVSVPPSGSTFSIGTSSVRSTAIDAAGNSNSCTFQVSVLGAQGVKSNVLAELTALSSTVTRPDDLAHLSKAISHLGNSLQPGIWLDQTHVARARGELAFNEESAAVQELGLLLKNGHPSLSQALVQGFIDRIVRADRLLAVVAVKDALATGADTAKLVQAQREIAQGDENISQGQYQPGMDDYRNAWKEAEHFTIKLAARMVSGNVHLEAAGFPGETYIIETSTNMLDWTTLGVTSAALDGSIYLDAAPIAKAQFYRARLSP